MSSNHFGQRFSVSTFGESHGVAIGCVVDGCPPGIALCEEDFQADLMRRATGRTRHTSQRHESDVVEILSGVYQGQTTGTPIALLIRNTDARSKDYEQIAERFRPGHADYTYWRKYGIRDPRGGGRSSARETTVRVAAAVIAKRYLHTRFALQVRGFLSQCGPLIPRQFAWHAVEATPLFWPDAAQIPELEAFLDGLIKCGDSVGGKVTVVAENVPVGLGEPLYGKLDGDLAAALMGINAVKAVEIGDGTQVISQRGSEHRDEMSPQGFHSNHSGGILGGISNGQPVVAHISIKPTSSIRIPGHSVDSAGQAVELVTKGRHDPCVAIRAAPIAEAMVALVLMDHVLRWQSQCGEVRDPGPFLPSSAWIPSWPH